MSLHYLNPEHEPRECPSCKGKGRRRPRKGRGARVCSECKGTGRLGIEGKEPDVEVDRVMGAWCWRLVDGDGLWNHTDADTPEAALAAARAEHDEARDELPCPVQWHDHEGRFAGGGR